MRLLTSREALIEKWALIGTTAIYRIITECLFACFQILQMLLIWGGGEGKIFLFGEEAFHFLENHSISLGENCHLILYKTKRKEPPDA